MSPFWRALSGPLNQLNAILSLLQPLDRYRTPSAIGSAIEGPYLVLSRFRAQLGVLNRLVLNRFRQGAPGSVRFGYGLGMERFERFRFSVPAVPLRRGFLCVFSTV